MTPENPTIFVVDEDPLVREALYHLLSARKFQVLTFKSLMELLAVEKCKGPGCALMDLQLPGLDSFAWQRRFAGADALPVVFMTNRADIASCVRAMRNGAIDVLPKPWNDECLLQAVEAALAADCVRRIKRLEMVQLQKRYAQLTPREREVLPLVTAGLLNKQTAAELGTSEITICVHRGQIMRKMAAPSLAELVRMADKLGVHPSRSAFYAPKTEVKYAAPFA